MELTFLVNGLDWDYENRGGVSVGEVISMQLEMVSFFPPVHQLESTHDKVLRQIPEVGLYEVSGEVSSAVSIGPFRAAILDCGVPIGIGYDYGRTVPEPHSRVAGFGALQALISFASSPLHTPVFGKVVRTTSIGEEVHMHLVTARIIKEDVTPKWQFDWRPTLFSNAVPRPPGLQIRVRRFGNLYTGEAFHPTEKDTWMSLRPMALQDLYNLLKELEWESSEILKRIEEADPGWRGSHPQFRQ